MQGRASPCNFRHDGRGVDLTVHGDDFTIVGDDSALKWIGGRMKERYQLKMDTLGLEAWHCSEVRVLNRIIRWGKKGPEYEPDQRHAEKIVQALGLEKAKPVATPWVDDQINKNKLRPLMCEELPRADATKYRAIAARVNYLAADRIDLLYASKCVGKYMSNPTVQSMEHLKRIGRFLKGKPRLIQHFPLGWG